MINAIPQNWQKVKLGQYAGVLGGFAFSSKLFNTRKVGCPVIKIQNLLENGYVDTNRIEFVDLEKLNKDLTKFELKNGDFLVAMTGATSGKVSILKDKSKTYYLNQRVGKFYIKDKNKLYKQFLYYSVISPYNQYLLYRLADGSAQGNMSSSQIEEILEIYIPNSLDEQNRIISALSSFDDKIEVNNKIAKTLEQMAQNIFKEWFVKFRFPGHEKVKFVDSELGKIPEGWEIKNLSKILQLKHGFAFKSEEFIQERTKFIVLRMGNFQEKGGLQFSDNTVYLKNIDNHLKYILDKEDMVMIFSDITREGRLIGNVGIIPDDENTYILNQRVVKIEHEKKHKYFLLSLFNSKAFHKHCLSRADSATVLNLKNEHIYDYQLALSGNEVLEVFNMIVTPFYKKIENIKKESGELAAMRDLLLPKLMRGEIRV